MESSEQNILVVDDEPINLQIMRFILKDYCQAAFATDGAKALELVKKIRPDLILLDVMMPEMDGFEVCSILKANPETLDIPVIFLTAKTQAEDILQGFSVGAVDYVIKPFRKEELLARVSTHLRLRKTEEALRSALLESRKAKEEAESALLRNLEMQKQIQQDLDEGAAMQRKFLTGQEEASELLQAAGFAMHTYNRPFATVSGDFFYPKDLNSGATGLFFADTCGHGLPAALISMRILGLLQSLPVWNDSPQTYLRAVSRDIRDVMPEGRFITACYLIFSENMVLISNAGQPFPVLISKGGVTEIALHGMPLGIIDSFPLSEVCIKMDSRDRLLLYSDGITECENAKGEMLGKARLLDFLKEQAFSGSRALKDSILNMLDEFAGGTPPADDITLIIIEKK
ncbi:MAG: PP2C family protein-serine/threonine phosphatase [Desulfococcaceae bacterium]